MFITVLFLFIAGQISNTYSQKKNSKLNHLTEVADIIVTGKVVKQKSVWNHNKTKIITHTTIQVEEYLKGHNSENLLVVNHLGGEVDGVGELYTHMPKFKNDEEVLLFLKSNQSNKDFKIINGDEGKITILKNSKTSEKITASNIPFNSLKMHIKAMQNRSK